MPKGDDVLNANRVVERKRLREEMMVFKIDLGKAYDHTYIRGFETMYLKGKASMISGNLR